MLDRIKSFFMRGGAKMGVVPELNKITDHPRIGVNPLEYDRIKDDLLYFSGHFPRVKYRNGDGVLKERDYMPLNMAQVICRRLATILVNENMSIDIKDKNALEYVKSVFDANDFNKNLERYLESGLALGGLALRPYVSGKGIKIAYIQAPVFYPLKSNTGDVSEAAIASHTTTTEHQQPVYWTLLEFHSWDGDTYHIDNELYRSTNKHAVGVSQPLSMMYPDLQEHVEMQGLKRPLFVYYKPYGFNNRDITSPLGLSVYDNARPTLHAINSTYDQFFWEVKMGQRKMAVPERMTKVYEEDGTVKQVFDSNQNVYVSVAGDMDDAKIQDLTSDIRTQEYTDAINDLLRRLEMQIGLSAGSLSANLATGNKTATEVVSENSMTYQTRSSHLTNVERMVQELVVSILELASAYDLYSGNIPEVGDVLVSFDDGVFTDKTAQLNFYAAAVGAGFQSKLRAIQKVFDVSETEAKKIQAEIDDEKGPVPMLSGDAAMFGSGSGEGSKNGDE